jgi:hypothetical protein
MERLIQQFIPGIIALICGLGFAFYWRNIVRSVLNSHSTFWKRILGFQDEVGKFGELFLKATILFLSIAFVAAGLFLIFQYLKK